MEGAAGKNLKPIFHLLIASNYHLASALLIAAGTIKILEPGGGELVRALFEQEVLPTDLLVMLTRFQPWGEIGLGLFAFFGWKADWTAKFLTGVYLFFSGVILYASGGYLTLPLDCGCFGEGGGTPVYLLLARNMLLATLLLSFNVDHRRWTIFHRLIHSPARMRSRSVKMMTTLDPPLGGIAGKISD